MKNLMANFFFLYRTRMGFYDVTIFYSLTNYVLITEKLGKIEGRNPRGLYRKRNYRYCNALGPSTVPRLNTSGSLPRHCWPYLIPAFSFHRQCNCLRVHFWQLCVWHWASCATTSLSASQEPQDFVFCTGPNTFSLHSEKSAVTWFCNLWLKWKPNMLN